MLTCGPRNWHECASVTLSPVAPVVRTVAGSTVRHFSADATAVTVTSEPGAPTRTEMFT